MAIDEFFRTKRWHVPQRKEQINFFYREEEMILN